jgi:hypothetical protein
VRGKEGTYQKEKKSLTSFSLVDEEMLVTVTVEADIIAVVVVFGLGVCGMMVFLLKGRSCYVVVE